MRALVTALVLLLAVLSLSGAASHAEPAGAGIDWSSSSGMLLVRNANLAAILALPALETQVELRVTGPIARARVLQRFANPTQLWQEAVYVFPLPPEAAVDALQMQVGERRIEGRIEQREQARRDYQHAEQEGRRASLLEQQRPNVFEVSVANLGPGESVEVTLEYQQLLRYNAGAFELRFPMVVAPRFSPGGEPAATPEPAVEVQVLDPRFGSVHPVHIDVELDAGVPLARLSSPSHAELLQVAELGEERFHVSLPPVPADRDFVLVWEPRADQEPQAALFAEEHGSELYALLMVLPPRVGEGRRLSREVVLVIDTSGSMSGASIEQARDALQLGLARLNGSDDWFEVLAFASDTRALFGRSVRADPGSLARAAAFVRSLGADGGTQVLPGLRAALRDEALNVDVRQVVLVTDGAVENESQLFELLASELGRSRLFTVGIGSAPNAYLMQRAAQLGSGTFTYIGTTAGVGERMEALLDQLERPVMRDIEVGWPAPAEAWPQRVPDLYDGEPLVVACRLAAPAGWVSVRGQDAGAGWQVQVPLRGAAGERGVGKLWARSKIAALLAGLATGADPERVRAEVVDVALRHHLVSRYTSLVAVDVTPARPRGTSGARTVLPVNLAHGARLPGTATASTLYALAGLALCALAAASALRTRPAERR